MLGWSFCILNLPPEKADRLFGRDAHAPFVLATWEAGIGGLDWVETLRKAGKATQLKNGGYPNRYTALAADFAPPHSLSARPLPARGRAFSVLENSSCGLFAAK